MKSIRQVLGQLTTVLTIEMAYLGNSIVESLNIDIHTGKAGPGGKDSPAWEPDAMTKVHNDTSKARLLKVLWGSAPLLRKGSKVVISFPGRGGGNPSPEIFRSHFKGQYR